MNTGIFRLLTAAVLLSTILAGVPSHGADRPQTTRQPGLTPSHAGLSRPRRSPLEGHLAEAPLSGYSVLASEAERATNDVIGRAPLEAPSVDADGENVEFVGHIGGRTLAVFVQENYAYIGEGPRVTILDISEPSLPVVSGRTEPLPGVVTDIYVSGGHAYVAAGDAGLRVIDVSIPSAPIEVGFYAWGERSATGVAVVGDYAYVASIEAGLGVIDVSVPSAPLEVAFYALEGLALDVEVIDDRAYVACDDGGLEIIDVSNPEAPAEAGGYDTAGSATSVTVVGEYAYVADYDHLRVVEVSDPSHAIEVGACDARAIIDEVAVAGDYAYLAAGYSGLLVMDVSDPSLPTVVGGYEFTGVATDAAVVGDHAYVAERNGGLVTVDVSVPSAPDEASVYDAPGESRGVDVVGGYGYVAAHEDGLRVIDLSTPSAPTEVGSFDTPGYAEDVTVDGGYAYLADWHGGLRIIDVSVPSLPTEVAACELSGYAADVAVVGDYAYVAAGEGGLVILDISSPATPIEVGAYQTPGVAYDVAVADSHAYVAGRPSHLDFDGWLWIIDVSIPSDPAEVGSFDTTGHAFDVAVALAPSGHTYAYIADGDSGLLMLDVSTPSAPTEVGRYDTPYHCWGWRAEAVAVTAGPSSSYAYVADRWTLRVIDVSDPSAPTEVGRYDTPSYCFDVEVRSNRLYLANTDSGLVILRHTGTHYSPSSDGYGFENSSIKESEWDLFRATFGAENVEWVIDGRIERRPRAQEYYDEFYEGTGTRGNCSGMAVSSMLLYNGWADPTDFLDGQGVSQAASLQEPDRQDDCWQRSEVVDFIVRYQGYQRGRQVRAARSDARERSVGEMVDTLRNAMDGELAEPQYVGIRGPLARDNACAGHALIPYTYTVQGPATLVYVYDANRPLSTKQCITMTQDSWEYDHNSDYLGTWRSGETCQHDEMTLATSLVVIPLSAWSESPEPPWDVEAGVGMQRTESVVDYYEFVIDEAATLRIENTDGQAVGNRNGELVEEIPGSYVWVPEAVIPDVVHDYPLQYVISSTQALTASVLYSQAGQLSLSAAAPGGLVKVLGVSDRGGVTDTVRVPPDASSVIVRGGSDGAGRVITIVKERETVGRKMTIGNFNLSAGYEARLDVGLDGDEITFASEEEQSTYDIRLSQVGYTSTRFAAAGPGMEAGDVHTIRVDWDRPVTATVEIDVGGDGRMDDTVVLRNQIGWLYLPVVLR